MENLDISTLEQAIERYPWFSLARLELFKKGCALGEDQKVECLKRAAAYVYSRAKLFEISNTTKQVDFQPVVVEPEKALPEVAASQEISVDYAAPMVSVVKETKECSTEQIVDEQESSEEISFEIETDPLYTEGSPKIVLAGGDYFNRTDFEALQLDTTQPLDKFIIEKPSLLRSNPSVGTNETDFTIETGEDESFEDSGFYTETLAKIYTQQGFYKRALDVYAKLILLYPEKSTYFATLVQDLKSKHNQ